MCNFPPFQETFKDRQTGQTTEPSTNLPTDGIKVSQGISNNHILVWKVGVFGFGPLKQTLWFFWTFQMKYLVSESQKYQVSVPEEEYLQQVEGVETDEGVRLYALDLVGVNQPGKI